MHWEATLHLLSESFSWCKMLSLYLHKMPLSLSLCLCAMDKSDWPLIISNMKLPKVNPSDFGLSIYGTLVIKTYKFNPKMKESQSKLLSIPIRLTGWSAMKSLTRALAHTQPTLNSTQKWKGLIRILNQATGRSIMKGLKGLIEKYGLSPNRATLLWLKIYILNLN